MLAQAQEVSQAVGTPIQNFGVAVGMLIVLLVALGLGLYWAATRLLQPALERHFKFLDRLESELQAHTSALVTVGRTLALVERRLRLDDDDGKKAP